MAPPPYLPDELVEEILLRLPPNDPASTLRASLVCKAWSSILSHPSFRRRLHDLHRTPPVLGFLHDWDNERIPNFIHTTASSFSLAAPDWRSWRAIDCRHGRALFLSKGQDTAKELLLWEPITGAQQRVPVPPAAFESAYPTAAVLCAADGCDHRACLGGPFRVVFVFFTDIGDAEENFLISACVYSSETGAWGEPALLHNQIANFTEYSSVLVGDSLLYFLSDGEAILEYDLASHSLTELHTPDNSFEQKFRLMLAAGNGELVLSESLDGCLYLWSRDFRCSWDVSREIYFGDLLPSGALEDWVRVLGFAEGANAIFVSTSAGLFMIDLQSEQARKVCDVRGWCNLIPVVGFYTPPHHPLTPRKRTKEETLKFAHELFDKGCKAIQGRNFANASVCFSHALKIRVLHYGKLAPHCASTFYGYGHALLCKAVAATNPLGSVSKSAPNEDSVKITATASKDAAGSSSASVSNSEHVPPSHRGDSEEENREVLLLLTGKLVMGTNLNKKDHKDVNMKCNAANSDLHLAWKMLDMARAIVVKSPEKTMEKVNIFYALAEVSMKREDRDSAIGYYLEALAILEHLVRPDDLRVAQINFRICLVFELISRVWDATQYCAKAISVCQSHIQNLKNAKEGLLFEKDIIAPAAGGHSEKITQEDKISSVTRMLAQLQKKLEELEQAMSTPSSGIDKILKKVVSQTSHEQNVSNTVARAASLDSQVAGSNSSDHFQTMPTGAATSSVSRGANDELILAEMIEHP